MSSIDWKAYLFFAFCAVSIIFIAVILPKICKSDFGGGRYSVSNDKPIPFVVFIAKQFSEAMTERGVGKFLMMNYAPPISLFDYDLTDKNIVKMKLHEILTDILKFLELPSSVKLKIDYESDDGTTQGEAGSYQNDDDGRIIVVKIKPFYTADNVIAILCHEVTHYFMEHNRLNWENTALNEQRTDVAANLIGFNRIMTAGYRKIQKVTNSWNVRTIESHKIGYITESDCRDIGDFLHNYRNNLETYY